MSIQIQAKQDISYLFSSLGSNASTAASSNFLGQYASIKNGSYYKLMKAYYGMNSSDSVKNLVNSTKKSKVSSEDTKTIANVQSTTDNLKESADAMLVSGSKSVFAVKDITTKDENGVETTKKGYDTDAVYKAVNSFVSDYNAVVKATDSASTSSIVSRAANMISLSDRNEKLLNQIGITINEDNTLSLDKDTFAKADMTTVKSLFNGSGSYGYSVSAQASLINFAADQAATRANTYTVTGTYGNTYNTGTIFNSYF